MLDKDIRLLNKVIKKGERGEVAYSDEELHKLRTKRRQLKDWKRSAQISQNNGFGQYINRRVQCLLGRERYGSSSGRRLGVLSDWN